MLSISANPVVLVRFSVAVMSTRKQLGREKVCLASGHRASSKEARAGV